MARGRHASTDTLPFLRDLAIMVLVIAVVAMLVLGLLSFLDGIFDGDDGSSAGDTTTSTPVATTTTTETITTTTVPSTTATTSESTTSTTSAPVTTVRPPSDVRVLVLNSIGVPGLAGRLADQLADLGYDIVTPTNYSQRLEQSRIWYQRGFGAEALELGAQIPDALIEQIPDQELDADVVVVLGESYEE